MAQNSNIVDNHMPYTVEKIVDYQNNTLGINASYLNGYSFSNFASASAVSTLSSKLSSKQDASTLLAALVDGLQNAKATGYMYLEYNADTERYEASAKTFPTASSSTLGGIKTGYTTLAASGLYKVQVDSSGNGYVSVTNPIKTISQGVVNLATGNWICCIRTGSATLSGGTATSVAVTFSSAMSATALNGSTYTPSAANIRVFITKKGTGAMATGYYAANVTTTGFTLSSLGSHSGGELSYLAIAMA